MVGDGLTDIESGNRVGCKTIWVGKWKCELCQRLQQEQSKPDFVVKSLYDVLQIIKY